MRKSSRKFNVHDGFMLGDPGGKVHNILQAAGRYKQTFGNLISKLMNFVWEGEFISEKSTFYRMKNATKAHIFRPLGQKYRLSD